MKLNYDKETDSLYIDLSQKSASDSREVAEGIVIDFDENGDVVGIDIQHASAKLDLNTVEIDSLPIPALKVSCGNLSGIPP